MNRQTRLLKASKDYLNNGTPTLNDGEVLPLVVFKYGGVRSVASVGFSVVSFIIPDGCLGLVIGRVIKNPVSLKSRVRVGYKDVKGFGVCMCVVGGYHSLRVAGGRKFRTIKRLLLGGEYL